MSWWRTNRWWLPVLPLCLVAMAVASAYRVHDLWWDTGLHHVQARATPGDPVTVTDDYTDDAGHTSRTFRVELSGITTARRMAPDFLQEKGHPPPPGDQVLVADLAWSAAPDQSLTGCSVALVDDRGRRYEPSSQVDLCVPSAHEGPSPPISRVAPRGAVEAGDARPTTWSTRTKVLAPAGVHITAVRIWWDEPDYVELPTG